MLAPGPLIVSTGHEAAAAMRAHLDHVHTEQAGFTETCATACRDAEGRDSYTWLAQALAARDGGAVLDLACGSGVLLERLAAERSATRLIGVDMSASELSLAATRLADSGVELRQGTAQDLSFLTDGSVDGVLCHWALALMKPVEPVLDEVARVLAPQGRFAAVVDGPHDSAPGYAKIDAIIGSHVGQALGKTPKMGLGDPRIRDAAQLLPLLETHFPKAQIDIAANVVSMTGTPDWLAREAAHFFYSTFVLDAPQRGELLEELAEVFAAQCEDTACEDAAFNMPINRVVVSQP